MVSLIQSRNTFSVCSGARDDRDYHCFRADVANKLVPIDICRSSHIHGGDKDAIKFAFIDLCPTNTTPKQCQHRIVTLNAVVDGQLSQVSDQTNSFALSLLQMVCSDTKQLNLNHAQSCSSSKAASCGKGCRTFSLSRPLLPYPQLWLCYYGLKRVRQSSWKRRSVPARKVPIATSRPPRASSTFRTTTRTMPGSD
jgi:hypothetical protein